MLAFIPVLTSLPTAPDKETKEDSSVNRTVKSTSEAVIKGLVTNY